MMLRRFRKSLLLATFAPLLLVADYTPQAPLGFSLVRESAAIIGRPLTPMSYAGVARRTTARVVAVEATAATAAVATTAAVASSAAAAQQSAVTQQQAAMAAQQQAVAQQQAATAKQQAAVAQQQAQAAGVPAVGTVVAALPPGCTQVTRNGIAYSQCGGAYYRAAFQGNNLVYVVQQP